MCEKEGCGEGGKKGMMVYRVRLFRVQDFKMLFPLLPRHPPHPPYPRSLLLSCWLYKSLHFALSKVRPVDFLPGSIITGLQWRFSRALSLANAAR